MIGRLHGEIVQKQPPYLLLDVNGVGYEVEAPMSTFYELPSVGEKTILFTHLVVRDDAQILFGFHREHERGLFRALLKVSGVGGKMALAILSGMSAEDFAFCVQNEDVTSLCRIPGVGKKTAQRLIIEMKDKLESVSAAPASMPAAGGESLVASPVGEAVSALVSLGYKPADANRMVKAVDEEGLASEELIRAALQSTVKGR